MNFGKFTLLLGKMKQTSQMELLSRVMGFEHSAILSVD